MTWICRFSRALLLPIILLHASITCAQNAEWQTSRPEDAASQTSPDSQKSHANELTLVLLQPGSILSANFPDVEVLANWTKEVSTICKNKLAKEKNPPRLLVQVTLRKDAAPLFELAGRPALGAKISKSLQAALSRAPDLRTSLTAVSFRLQQIDHSASPDVDPIKLAESFKPVLVPPEQKQIDAFHKASIAEQYMALRQWAREEALPLLSTGARVDEKFAGVRSIGNMLATLSFDKPLDVEKLTFENSNYWRGILEMVPGNHQVVAASVMLFVANGEMSKASELFGIVRAFAQRDTLASALYDHLDVRLRSLVSNIDWEIKQAIVLHDQGKFDKAIAAYKKVLADYPCSAWARYEVFFSEAAKLGSTEQGINKPGSQSPDVIDLWKKSAPEIYRLNPLYTTQFFAERGKSVGSLLDRLTISKLNKDRAMDRGEYFGSAAQAMTNLEAYGYAAHIYGLSLATTLELKESTAAPDKTVKEKTLLTLSKEDAIARFLYCLEKLGCTEIKKNFKGDFATMFQKMDATLKQHREQ